MQYLPDGKVKFDDTTEMYYNLFMDMGFSINDQQYLYDQDTGTCLIFKDKYIKATFGPNPIYAGRNDIVFDPSENFSLIINLFGYFLDKFADDEEKEFKYIAHYVEDDPAKTKQRLVVRTSMGDFATKYYYCLYLAYIEAIFTLNGNYSVDLSNFDVNKFNK